MDDSSLKTLDRSNVAVICNVSVEKVRVEYLAPAMQSAGLVFDSHAPIAAMIEAYADWTATHVHEFADCTVCGGSSDASLDVCAYCGDAGSAIVPITPVHAEIVQYTETDLDEAVDKTHQLKAAVVKGHWYLGRHLAEVKASGVWRARKAADGESKYKTFEKFCLAEIGMTDSNVNKLINVAGYFSEDAVAKLGTEKLDLIMRAPEAMRPALLAKVEASVDADPKGKGMSTKKVIAEVNEARTTAGAPPAPKPKAAPAREFITMVDIEGEKTFPMLSRSALAKGQKSPALDIADAVGFHYPVNDVVFIIRPMRNDAGEWLCKIAVKREK